MFPLTKPDEGRKLTDVLMISYALIKMVINDHYAISIERWKHIHAAEKKQWVEFRAFFISEYESMII